MSGTNTAQKGRKKFNARKILWNTRTEFVEEMPYQTLPPKTVITTKRSRYNMWTIQYDTLLQNLKSF